MRFEPAKEFFRLCLGEEWQSEATPVKLSGDRVMELLWPLNEVFRPRLPEVESLPYDSTFETEADSVIDDMAVVLDTSVLGQAPANVVRVLLERHKQMLMVATTNRMNGNPVTTLPAGLSATQQRIGLVLLLLRGMELPWPPSGPGPSVSS